MDRNQIRAKARGNSSVETPPKAKSTPKAIKKAPTTAKKKKVAPQVIDVPTPSDLPTEEV